MQDNVGESWKANEEYHKVADFMGLNPYEKEDFETANKISILRDWGGLQGKDDLEGALNALSDLKSKYAGGLKGKQLVNQLYQYVRLQIGQKKQPSVVKSKEVAKPVVKEPSVKATLKTELAKATSIKSVIKNELKSSLPKQSSLRDIIKSELNNSVSSMIRQSFLNKKAISITVQNAMSQLLK